MKVILETRRLLLRELRQEDFDDACLLLQEKKCKHGWTSNCTVTGRTVSGFGLWWRKAAVSSSGNAALHSRTTRTGGFPR